MLQSNDFYNISGAMLASYTTGTTGWDNVITTGPTYPVTPQNVAANSGPCYGLFWRRSLFASNRWSAF